MVDPMKIAMIVNLEAPRSVKQLCTTLGHTRYCRKFIRGYTQITMPMEKFLKKDVTFYWNDDCKKSLDILNANMVTTLILVFPNWKKELHLHVDASCIALGAVITKDGGEGLDHPIAFTSHKLSKAKKNYLTTECKGLAMVHALQMYQHYLLGGHFKMYADHFVLKYLVNKPVLGGRICGWLLLFQEYDFKVVMKPGGLNVGPDHLSRIEIGEEPTSLEDGLPDVQLFVVWITDGHFEDIIHFLATGIASKGYYVQQKKELVVRVVDFYVIVRNLYKMGNDEILRRYVPNFERSNILADAHEGTTRGHHVL